MEYLAEWNCGKCGRALRARFKPESVRGPYFTEHEEERQLHCFAVS